MVGLSLTWIWEAPTWSADLGSEAPGLRASAAQEAQIPPGLWVTWGPGTLRLLPAGDFMATLMSLQSGR